MTTLLSVLGILISLGAIILVVQLQTRVDSLEQRLARYDYVFETLRKSSSASSLDVNGDSVDSGLIDLDASASASAGKDDYDDPTTIDSFEDLARRLSPIVALNNRNLEESSGNNLNLSTAPHRSPMPILGQIAKLNVNLPGEQDQFDQFVYEVSAHTHTQLDPFALSCVIIIYHLLCPSTEPCVARQLTWPPTPPLACRPCCSPITMSTCPFMTSHVFFSFLRQLWPYQRNISLKLGLSFWLIRSGSLTMAA